MAGAVIASINCTRLVGTGKKGIIKPDADGYYDIMVGALGVLNSQGDLYLANQEVIDLFNESSDLIRRAKAGQLRCESGHPRMTPGMTDDQYLERVMDVQENNTCCHMKDVRLVSGIITDPGSENAIAIMAKVRPYESIEAGRRLKEQLDNGQENVSFSIRCFSKDVMVGNRKVKAIKRIVCWDYVNEPGINHAEKYKSPSMESLVSSVITSENIYSLVKYRKTMGLATESKTLSIESLIKDLGINPPDQHKARFLEW